MRGCELDIPRDIDSLAVAMTALLNWRG